MQKWEYRTIDAYVEQQDEILESVGGEGWELVSACLWEDDRPSVWLYFKRPVESK